MCELLINGRLHRRKMIKIKNCIPLIQSIPLQINEKYYKLIRLFEENKL